MIAPPPERPRIAGGRRILFLDDDQRRASAFLEIHPDAVWVQTVEGCLERLAEPWDEVHLDHDLGGETFVDPARDDCGMAVVRWLGRGHGPHLGGARFVVHSHNPHAACVMVLHLLVMGFQVESRPFGAPPARGVGTAVPGPWRRLARQLRGWLGGGIVGA